MYVAGCLCMLLAASVRHLSSYFRLLFFFVDLSFFQKGFISSFAKSQSIFQILVDAKNRGINFEI
jgi:hypothetical protein